MSGALEATTTTKRSIVDLYEFTVQMFEIAVNQFCGSFAKDTRSSQSILLET